MKLKLIIVLLLSIMLGSTKAQNKVITLSGVILCEDSNKGSLSFVNIYNKNTQKGTVSNTEGKFSIKMGKNDTILFSTVQHEEQFYYIKENDFFYDKSIEITMIQDTVWLQAVNIMGIKNYEEFKRDLLQLDFSNNDIAITFPIINKYAKQNSSGEGAFEIKGPLTYLSKKYYKILKRKNKH